MNALSAKQTTKKQDLRQLLNAWAPPGCFPEGSPFLREGSQFSKEEATNCSYKLTFMLFKTICTDSLGKFSTEEYF
jgi:hypothetical protein